MYSRYKKQSKKSVELAELGKKIFALIQEGKLDEIKQLIEPSQVSPSTLLHLYDKHHVYATKLDTMISAINRQPNPALAPYFFSLISREYESLVASAGASDLVELTDSHGFKLFHWAIAFNQVAPTSAVDKHLLPIKSKAYESASHLAAATGAVNSMKYLLDQGVTDTCLVTNYAGSLLTAALHRNQLAIAKLLLSRGLVNIDEDYKLRCPFIRAAEFGYTDIIAFLISNYRYLHTQDMIKTAMSSAMRAGYADILPMLFLYLDNKNIDFLVNEIDFTLSVSEDKKQDVTACLRFLLDHGVSPNEKQTYSGPFLYRAIYNKNTEATKLLLSRGANITLPGARAVVEVDEVDELSEDGDELEHTTLETAKDSEDFRYSTIEAAAYACDVAITKILFEKINPIATSHLNYILDFAINLGNIEMVDLLVSKGAQLQGKDYLSRAMFRGHTALVTALLTTHRQDFSNGDMREAAHTAFMRGCFDVFKMLYQLITDVHPNEFAADVQYSVFSDEQRRNSYHTCLKFLFEQGMDPNFTETNGTMLARVVDGDDKCDLETVRILLDAGANPNATVKILPIISAINNHNIPLLELLFQYNANVDVSNPKGVKAIDIARKRRFADIVAILGQRLSPSDAMKIDVSSTDKSNHYYIKCNLTLFCFDGHGAELPTVAWFFMKSAPQLLERMPVGLAPSCSYSQLSEHFESISSQYESDQEESQRLSYDEAEEIADAWHKNIDFGFDAEQTQGKELREIDFYYDCGDLDKATALRAIEKLQATYCKQSSKPNALVIKDDIYKDRSSSDDEVNFYDAPSNDAVIIDPAYIITKALIESQPASEYTLLPRFSLIRPSATPDIFNQEEKKDNPGYSSFI